MGKAWDAYRERMDLHGQTKHDMWINHSRTAIGRRLLDSPSCRRVLVNGEEQTLSITRHAESGYKKVASMPGEHLVHGGLVDFANGKWLITDVDPDDQVYQRGVMRQCNHILRWVSQKTGEIREKWCVVEDGTKYLIGERTKEFLTIGDGRMAVTIAKDPETIELCRGLRFLIDDEDSDFVTAYQITKSNKLFNVYNGEGVFRFILNEVQLTDDDDTERRIADFKSRMEDGSAASIVPVFPDYYIQQAMEGNWGVVDGDVPDDEEGGDPGSEQPGGAGSKEEQGGWL